MVEFIYKNKILLPSTLAPDFLLVLYHFHVRFDTNVQEVGVEDVEKVPVFKIDVSLSQNLMRLNLSTLKKISLGDENKILESKQCILHLFRKEK